MAVTLNANTSTGFIATSDTSGVLQLQTGGTTAVTVDASQNVGLGVTPSAWSGAKAFQTGSGGVATTALWDLSNNTFLTNGAYWNGSNYIYVANSFPAARYVQTSGAHTWSTAASGTAGNAISFTQAMTLDASGNLGIGTSSPAAPLHVSGVNLDVNAFRIVSTTGTNASAGTFRNTGGAFYIGLDNSTGSRIQVSSGSAYAACVWHEGAYPVVFGTSNAERARITSAGELLVAKTSSGSTLTGFEVGTDGANTSRVSIGGANSSSATGLSLYSTTASAFRFFVSYSGQINATSTSITAISDATLKENVRDLETGLTEVMALRPRRFDWREETQLPDRNVAGFIAQEVEQVLPELVYDYKYSAEATKKSLKMGDILPTLVKAIQEQQAIIQTLTDRITALEGTTP